MSFDVNITVNGNRCKQYQFQGKTFVEAKDGSEYVVELKNNYYKRVLAVSSVDGLNVLTGKSASDTDTGYIVGSHAAEKIKGFRFSDDEWAMFKFGYKYDGKTYAQSKGDGSERNCGVIGVKFFYENEPVYTCVPNSFTPAPTWPKWPKEPAPNWPDYWPNHPYKDTGTPPPIWYTTSIQYSCGNTSADWAEPEADGALYDSDLSAGGGRGMSSGMFARSATKSAHDVQKMSKFLSATNSAQNMVQQSSAEVKPQSFDMGTEWGRKEASKVHTVSFDRGSLAQTFEIFYASRASLIDMGVIVDNKLQANLPQSFPSQYATPPKNWRG